MLTEKKGFKIPFFVSCLDIDCFENLGVLERLLMLWAVIVLECEILNDIF